MDIEFKWSKQDKLRHLLLKNPDGEHEQEIIELVEHFIRITLMKPENYGHLDNPLS